MTETPHDLTDPALRESANRKLRRGFELRAELHDKMHGWWNSNPVTLKNEVLDDGKTVELIMTTRSMPKVEDWWDHANDSLQNFRNALDRFHHAVCLHFAPEGWKGHLYFPITRDADKWKEWVKHHSMIPREVQMRYLAFQPWYSGRDFLRDLARITNLEKHEGGVVATISLTKMALNGTTRIEGIWGDEGLQELMKLEAGETNAIVAPRQVISRVTFPGRIIDLGDLADESKVTFEPLAHFDGDEEVPVLLGIQLISQEVTWAISYIAGLVGSTTDAPKQNVI